MSGSDNEINHQPAHPPERWVTDVYLANKYSVTRQTIWRWAREGRIRKPRHLAPGTTRWNEAGVDEDLFGQE